MQIHKNVVINAKSIFDLKKGSNIFVFSAFFQKTTFYQNTWDYGLFTTVVGRVYFL